jgi:hypothetical protein
MASARVINSKGKRRNVCTYVNGNKSDPNVTLRGKCLYATRPIKVGEELLLRYPYRPKVERNCMVSDRELPVPTIRVPKVNENVEVKFNKRIVRIATFHRGLRIRRI